MSIEETIRAVVTEVVRAEVRAALRELGAGLGRPTGNPDDRLTLTEAAALARRSSATVKRWVDTGQLKFSRRGQAILITRSDLDEFLQAEAEPSSDAQLRQQAQRLVKGER